MERLVSRLRFLLERWIQGGAGNQLLLMIAIIGLVAVIGGTLAFALSGAFDSYGDAVWWSFLRLSDPGYLGDDEGALLRTISTIITVLGYVLFLGSLIAIMTQWLTGTVRRLESGLSPITVSGHVLILGWTNRTPNLLRELLAGEDKSGLRRRSKPPRVVVLADSVTPSLRHDVRESLGEDYDRWRVILRSGSALRIEHLQRVDYRHAAAIIIPGSDFSYGGYETSDARVVKSLLTISHHLDAADAEKLPNIIAEVLDLSRRETAARTYPGPLEIVSSDALISRLIVQSLRNPGASRIYAELLTHSSGSELYTVSFPEVFGSTFGQASARLSNAVSIGILRTQDGRVVSELCPPPDYLVREGDQLVVIARGEDGIALLDEAPVHALREGTSFMSRTSPQSRRILILGWNHRVYQLASDLRNISSERVEIDLMSEVPIEARATELQLRGISLDQINLLSGDYTETAVLGQLDLASYDNILFLGNNWMANGDDTDANTLLGFITLQSAIADRVPRPPCLVELMHAGTAPLLSKIGEVLMSPQLVSHILAHVAIRPELNVVINDLLAPDGAEILFQSSADAGLVGETRSFGELQLDAMHAGLICLGVRNIDGSVSLNPPRGRTWAFSGAEAVIYLSRPTSGTGTAS
jgi:ion channel POLLUX/CASTOR